ncbi:pilus assembly protein PilW [Neisseria brasiliensis]|nr:pilus assembly protein PilW [Neisseria brasiliensis]
MKNKRPTFNHPPKMQGFSLIEFLVASALSMIVLMAVTSTYFTARNLNNAATSRLSVQQDLRHASTLLVRDARMAGSFGCFNMVNYPPSAIIKDESKAPFNLASNATDKGMIPIVEVTTINSPGFSPNADSTILIFQYGIDDTAPNKNVAVFSSCNRLYKPINNNLNDASDTFSKEIGEDNKGSISILRHMVVAYAVGKFGEQEGLYRFQLNDSGNWEAPQLLIKDVTCRKSSRCLHHRLRKISLQDLKRRIAVQTAVRLHSVIEINKAAQLLSPVFRTVKQLFLMPHLHQGADNPFRLTVGLRTGNPGKLLTNPVLITGYTESMVG